MNTNTNKEQKNSESVLAFLKGSKEGKFNAQQDLCKYIEKYAIKHFTIYKTKLRQDAKEDVILDVQRLILKNIDSIDLDRPFEGYLKSSIKNKAIDYYKKEIRSRQSIDIDDIDIFDESSLNEAAEIKMIIDKAMSRLKPKEAACLYDYHFKCMLIRQIAEEREMTESSVKKYLVRGRARLAKQKDIIELIKK